MKLTEAEVGRLVIYYPEYLRKSKKILEENFGWVTSVNDKYVFVKYNGNEGSKATPPEDLFFFSNDFLETIEEI